MATGGGFAAALAARRGAQGADEARGALLVVDDEVEVATSIADQLRRGYRVLTASSADEALRVLAEENVSVIVTDQRMPGKTGVELLAEAARTKPDVVRILLTGYSDIEAVIQAVNQGRVYHYLTKPWDPHQLETVLRKAFEHQALVRANRALLEELRQANAELEQRVRERTAELADKNAALEEMNRLKNELLGMAAHDLRSPIGNVESLAEILLDPGFAVTDEDRDDYLRTIRDTARRMLALLGDLLDVARIETGKIDLALAPHAVRELVAEAVAHNRLRAAKKHIALLAEVDADVGQATFDRARIAQVLDNLIGNALKFSSAQTTVRVVARRAPEAIELAVIDQGQGIPEGEIGKLFGTFQRTTVRPTGDEPSSGLGLAICKKLVTLHGGTIGVESAVGQGSRFHFSLPCTARTGSASGAGPSEGGAGDGIDEPVAR